jgi:autotransporter-associated beta strand protein
MFRLVPRHPARFASAAVAAVLLAPFAAGSARAQNATKADNPTNMGQTGSYVGGVLPGTSGTIFFNNTLTAVRSPNAGGIQVAALNFENTLTQSFTFNSGTLTLGAGGLTKNDTSTRTTIQSAFILSAPQTWNVNSSELSFGPGGSLTTNGNAVTIQGAGEVRFTGTTTLNSDVTIAVSGSVVATTSTSDVTLQGLNTFDSLTIGSNARVTGNSLGNFGVASAFGDGGTNTAIIIGSQTANGTLVYSGSTASSNRRFQRTASTIADAANAAIEVSTPGQTLTLTGSLGAASSSAVTSGWRFGGAGNLTIESIIPDFTGAGQQTILKDGTGTLRLSANNTYEGLTTVSAGTLLVLGQSGSNSGTGLGSVSVAAAGTLGGTGRIAGATTVSGAVSPGDGGIGTLTVANSLTWNAGQNWAFDLGAANSADKVSLTAGSFLKGTGSGWTFDFKNSTQTGTFTLVDWSGTTGFVAGDFSYVNLGGVNTGTFAVQGNALTLVVVPEPATIVLLGSAGIAVCAGWVRRRRPTCG